MTTIDPQWVLQDETVSVQQMLFADEGESVPLLRYAQVPSATRLVLETGMAPCPVVVEPLLQMPSVSVDESGLYRLHLRHDGATQDGLVQPSDPMAQ